MGGVLDRVDADAPRRLVEEDVARNLDAAMQVDMAVAALLPAMEIMIAEAQRAGAEDGKILVQSRLHRRHRHRRLKSRTGRIDAGQHLVDQRLVIVGGQRLPFVLAEPDIEEVGIEPGRRRHRQHVPVRYVHHHTRGALVADALVDELLQLLVDGEPDVVAGLARGARKLADDAAIGVDLDAADAGGAAHLVLELLFDAALANAKARQIEQRVVDALLVVGRDRGDIAQNVGKARAIGIGAGLADIGLHAGQIGQMQVEARELFPGKVLGHRHGQEFLVLLDVVQNLLLLPVGQLDDPGDAVECGLDAVGRLLGHQQHAIIAPVVGELDAEAVDDAPARRRDQALADAIGFGLRAVLVAVLDLKLIEPPAQHGKDRRHAARHHQGAAREGRVAALVLAVEARHQKSLRIGPTSLRCTRPRNDTTGMNSSTVTASSTRMGVTGSTRQLRKLTIR